MIKVISRNWGLKHTEVLVKMPEHEYANCRVAVSLNNTDKSDVTYYLYSYQTCVIGYNVKSKRLYCSGLYSRTTINHIGWFVKNFCKGIRYYDVKDTVLKGDGTIENVMPGEYAVVELYK